MLEDLHPHEIDFGLLGGDVPHVLVDQLRVRLVLVEEGTVLFGVLLGLGDVLLVLGLQVVDILGLP